MLSLAIENPRQAEVLALMDELDAYQKPLSPPESFHGVDIDALCAPAVRCLVLRDAAGRAQGCGAVGLGDFDGEPAGELKRIYLRPVLRGQGAGARLVAELERIARAEGARRLYLETGVRQLEAIRLYERLGYRHRGPFGDYLPDP
ncbi:MAG: GNAT family N-acetyltransferase, partial [Inhella sp.]